MHPLLEFDVSFHIFLTIFWQTTDQDQSWTSLNQNAGSDVILTEFTLNLDWISEWSAVCEYSRLWSLTSVFLMGVFSSLVFVYSCSQARVLVSGHLGIKSSNSFYLRTETNTNRPKSLGLHSHREQSKT